MAKKLFIFLSCLVVVALVGVWYFFMRSPEVAVYNPQKVEAVVGSTTPPPREVPADKYEYRNIFFRLSLLYPKDGIVISERKGAGTTLTVLFEQKSTGRAFQIYILPYGEPKISKERFLLDMPSGVMSSSTTMQLDGVDAGAFYGKDAELGETREVWVVNKGFLYEATAPKEQGEWMDAILQTWMFL